MADRYFSLMRAGMGRFPAVDAVVRLATLTEAVQHYYAKGEAISFVTTSGSAEDHRNAIIIADVEDTPLYFSILMVRGDPGRTIPGFVNLRTRKVTTIRSDEPDSVRGSSCHLVISKQEIAAGREQGSYRMVMEQATGISRILARDFLGSLLTRFAADHGGRFVAIKKVKKRGEQPEEIEYRPTVRFHPQQNASLKSDLEEGKIGGFKLVRGITDFTGEADEPRVQKLDVQLRAQIDPTNEFGKVRALVERIRSAIADVEFEALKLELVDDGGAPITNPRVIELVDMDDSDMRYCKRLPIKDANSATDEVYVDLHEDILNSAKTIISADSHWN
ncbi:hypothetical protein [Terrihabitans rhizophilus]|uniref:Uncharacterized protein n=1 Tax=Terrihabitans rhizophilus TaxID=3092662 RepID=A0ABU4RQM4_9HYPH|nr:hypothetical protein [Terrihabitans sp. PJ23]MDX6805066.1 hypothetical protein [Terrihabitans sp. PJ23]